MISLGWPQIVYLALTVLGMGFILAQHGRPKTGTYNFVSSLCVSLFCLWLLWMGGFFSQGGGA